MTEIRLAGILKKQMADREKRRRADFVLPSGLGRNLTLRRLRSIFSLLRGRALSCGAGRSRRMAQDRRRRR
jgi:dephospho-CoA kinase